MITRMIIGGAQENTLLTVLGLQLKSYGVTLITGTEQGPEGRLDLGGVRDCRFVSSLVRNINIWKDLKAVRDLYVLFKKEKFDVIHTHSSKAGIIGRIAARLANVPVIIHTVHGLPFHPYQHCWMNALYMWLEKRAATVTDKIVVVSPEMSRKCIEKNIAPALKFVTVYSGMVLLPFTKAFSQREANRQKMNIDPHTVVIGTIARLSPLKGHEQILEVASDIVKKNDNVRFLWVGDGWIAESLKEKIKKLGLLRYFIFTGLVSPDLIPYYTSVMDILVHTSLREGLARAMPQAFACKVPVVSFAIDGAVDIIRDNENGFLIDSQDSQGLFEKMLQLVNDPVLRKSMGEKGYQEVLKKFDHGKMVDDLEKLYQSCHS